MAVPVAPPDASGGFMVIQQTNGTDTHRMRVHVLPFSLTEFVVSGTPETYGADDGHHNYAYSPHTPAGAEMGVSDTFAAFVNLLKPLYSSVWTFSLYELFQIVDGVPVEVFPPPTPTNIAGTSAAGAPVGLDRTAEAIYNMRTSKGGKARLTMQAVTLAAPMGPPQTQTNATGGSAATQALLAYLASANTAIVGHDGSKLVPSAHVTYVYNRRLRRKYGYA